MPRTSLGTERECDRSAGLGQDAQTREVWVDRAADMPERRGGGSREEVPRGGGDELPRQDVRDARRVSGQRVRGHAAYRVFGRHELGRREVRLAQ